MRLFSIVFNEPYLTWFEQACVPSLMWPKNRAALEQVAAWDLWTTPTDAERVLAIARKLGLPIEMHAGLQGGTWADKAKLKVSLTDALVLQIERCVRDSFLWLAPDNVFGDGTIQSIAALGSVPGVCVALAPMRVDVDKFMQHFGPEPWENEELVRLAFRCAHQGFKDAEATLPKTNSMESGVSWRQIGEGLYAVTHRKHSAYLMQPTPEDAHWFRKNKKFGAYDHGFPQILVDTQRQRVIGSSDAAFVVELTPAAAHVPPLRDAIKNEPDRYGQDLSHHRANRNVVCIWRAS